jgi:hypothetical protein
MNKPIGHRSHLSGWKRMLRHMQKVNWQEYESERLEKWLKSYQITLRDAP